MKKYPSKISLGLFVCVFGVFIWAVIHALYSQNWMGLIFIGLVLVFISHIFVSTFYIVEDNFLIIKAGFLVNKRIDIASIRKITETNNLMSSPALSLDRLDISYNKFDSILISPKDKLGFIARLTEINPEIEVKCK